MSLIANLDNPNGPQISSKDAANMLNPRNHLYYCVKPGCNAHLHLDAIYSDSPYFSSYNQSDHAYRSCVRRTIDFHPDEYSESAFHLEETIDRIVNQRDNNIHRDLHGVHRGNAPYLRVGNDTQITIGTTHQLFGMADTLGVTASYNNTLIGSFYACEDNSEDWLGNFHGFVLVLGNYYRKTHGIPEILLRYPSYNAAMFETLRIIFPSAAQTNNFYKRARNHIAKNGSAQIVVAAIWDGDHGFTDDEIEFQSSCHINKMSQIFIL